MESLGDSTADSADGSKSTNVIFSFGLNAE